MVKTRARPLRDSEYALLADFRSKVRGFFAFSKAAVAEAGLAPKQYEALLAVRARRGREMTIGDLADELYIRHHSAVGLVDRLEKSGLMMRDNSPAGRKVVLSLTSRAETVLASLAEVHLMELRRYAPAIIQLFSEPDAK